MRLFERNKQYVEQSMTLLGQFKILLSVQES